MRKILRHTALTSVTALAIALAAPGQAETTTTVSAPFTRGQMCYKYPTSGTGYGWFCHNAPAPYGYLPNQWDTAAPFNAIAETARGGELVVGGWERLGTSYLVNAYRASSAVDFNGPPTAGPISASAQIAGLNVSSPTVNKFLVCLRIIDLGPINGYGYPTVLAADCFGKSTPFRALSATASSVGADREIRVEVSLDNSGENGGAKATVSSISYTLP